MMQRAHVKLVTVIAASEMYERVKRELVHLGASNHSVVRVEGRGHHGTRTRDTFDDGNVRFETLVGETIADAILQYVATVGEAGPVIAFAQNVEAVPRNRFE
jgi:nitrogen regulatory protein PII